MRTKPIGKIQEELISLIVNETGDVVGLDMETKKELARSIFLSLLDSCNDNTSEAEINRVLNGALNNLDYFINASLVPKNKNF